MGRPPQRWGWHQLHPEVAQQLVADARLPRRSLVLDVGAGLGAITEPLVDAGHRVIAIEAHPHRVRDLRARVGEWSDDRAGLVTVVRADAADLRLPRRPFHVVANPPFAVTSALLRRLLHPGSRLVSARLVLQDQAVRRWTSPAAPAAARWRRDFHVEAGHAVARASFTPAPATGARILVVRRR